MQPGEFIQFLLGIAGVSLAAQGEAEIVMRLFKVRFQFDGTPKGGNGPGGIAPSLQFPAQVVLSVGIVRIERYGGAKLLQRALMVRLTPQNQAEHEVR